MPNAIETRQPLKASPLIRDDGTVVQRSLFSPTYRDDFNEYEQKVACYIDGDAAIHWWHRNVARHHYSVQGWRRHRVYPDFLIAQSTADGVTRLLVVETKGDQLKNSDSDYKQALLRLCSEAFDTVSTVDVGQLELGDATICNFAADLVYQEKWKVDLAALLAS